MEFTEIKELDKLINFSRSNDKRDLLDEYDSKEHLNLTMATHYVSIRQTDSGEVEELLREIDMYAMSMLHIQPQPEINYGEEFGNRLKAQTEFRTTISPVDDKQDVLMFTPKKHDDLSERMMLRNSNMFRNSIQKNPYLKKENKVKIFYFGKPVCKVLNYSNQTTIGDLIERAIFAYLEDPTLDKNRLRTTQKSAYELRMLDDDAGFKPDMELEALDHNRKAVDTMFDALVLMENHTIQVSFDETDEHLIQQSPTIANTNLVRVFDENGQDVLKKYFSVKDTVGEIFSIIVSLNKYPIDKIYLTETVDDELEVMEETKIAELETKKLFIKIRRFADDPEMIKHPPIIFEESLEEVEKEKALAAESAKKPKSPTKGERKNQIKPVLDQEFNLMTLTQASNYQQFTVIKVNTWGARQERVLGIDQTKIYNYDKDTHKEGEVSLFSKLMGKSSYGTKKPERSIKDIVKVREAPEKNLLIIECKEGDKTKELEYEVSAGIRFRIIQKLSYLMKYLSKTTEKN